MNKCLHNIYLPVIITMVLGGIPAAILPDSFFSEHKVWGAGPVDLNSDGQPRYISAPNPGDESNNAFIDFVADTQFSVDRGFYDKSFQLEITTDTEEATIHYTTNGTAPTTSYGTVYSGPITISRTTVLRAIAYRSNYIPSNVNTQTYIFTADVITQAAMDVDVIGPSDLFGGVYAATIEDDLKVIPTLSLVMDDDEFDNMYSNYTSETEVELSVEYYNPTTGDQFQIDAGVEMYGRGAVRFSKKPMKLNFRSIYGQGKLDYPLLGYMRATSFDQLVLRSMGHDSWLSMWQEQDLSASYIRDEFLRRTQEDMGHVAAEGMFVHLYINGTYWGQYNVVERINDSFAADYFGGEDEDYDVIRPVDNELFVEATQGNMDAWDAMLDICRDNSRTADEKYEDIQQYLDMDNFIDYMSVMIWSGIADWLSAPGEIIRNMNWCAVYNRNNPEVGYQFFVWDAEITMGKYHNGYRYLDRDMSDVYQANSPGEIYDTLRQSNEFQLYFADRVYMQMFNSGAMSLEANAARWLELMDAVDESLTGESARWGDDQSSIPYTPNDEWRSEVDWVLNTFLTQRTDIVIEQFRDLDLFPSIDAPLFKINGFYQHGGDVSAGDLLTMDNPNSSGMIYYTLNGSDPRLPGDDVNPAASIFDGGTQEQIVLVEMNNAQWKYLYDGSDQGTAWRQMDFDDDDWNSGLGQLGFGDGDETTNIGPQVDGLMSAYFRHIFTVSDVADYIDMSIDLIYDDGAALYINDQEVRRVNMPGETVYYNTPSDRTDGDNATISWAGIDPAILNEGNNILAIEVHQQTATSSDISFDLRLTAAKQGEGGTTGETFAQSALVKARVMSGSTWSALNEAAFAVGPVAEYLRITEIMYHPQDEPAGDPNAEFIELMNIGAETINLNLVRFDNGINYTFPNVELLAGEFVIIVKDQTAFAGQYPGFSGVIAGEYTGSLDNGGERVSLVDAIGDVIHDFKYKDSWYDNTDGDGFSLTVRDATNTDSSLWDEKQTWSFSNFQLGNPGSIETGAWTGEVVINEILAHADTQPGDWIELYNTTNRTIDLSGWFLSDDADNLQKYEIASGVKIAPYGYIVFTQTGHFGNVADSGCNVTFALSENGETVYLSSGSAGVLTGLYGWEEFGASLPDVSMGRYRKSTGAFNFVQLSSCTPSEANSYPEVGPVVISEIMYHPQTNNDAEYVELLNISGVELELYDAAKGEAWRFMDEGGIEFIFPTPTTGGTITLHPDERILLVKNRAVFDSEFTAPVRTQILEWTTGSLNNAGEKIQLSQPGDTDALNNRYWIRVDRVVYSDGSHPAGDDPWPPEPDGLGQSLQRIHNDQYGNDPANWQTAMISKCGEWGYQTADINKDCVVDIEDLLILASQWLGW